MFTGLVEEIGRIRELIADADGARCSIAAERVLEGLAPGDSVAVDGACLTVAELDPGGFWVGLSPETRRRTNLGERRAGDPLNLERAVRVGDRLGGHYVQGHVDGVGRIVAERPDGDSLRMWFSAPPDLLRYIVVKGYICIDGISLTVTERSGDRFGVALVAYTRGAVSLPGKPVGATVNLEVDVIAKYVESLLEARVEREDQR
jgi:riboflavin synthase